MSRRRALIGGSFGGALGFILCMVLWPQQYVELLIVPVAAAALVVVATLLVGVIAHARRHHALAAELLRRARPAGINGVVVHELDGLEGALVAGLRHPRIFCGRDLASRLPDEELRAVLLHEQFHLLDRAPAKMVLLEAVQPFVRHVESGRAWLARRLASLEIAADHHAVAHGSSREALASALLKLPATSPGAVGTGFASATELRLQALLDEQPRTRGHSAMAWVLVPAVALGVCLLLVLTV